MLYQKNEIGFWGLPEPGKDLGVFKNIRLSYMCGLNEIGKKNGDIFNVFIKAAAAFSGEKWRKNCQNVEKSRLGALCLFW